AAAPLAGAAATAGIAYVLQLAAYAVALVAVVELVKRVTSMVFALAIGRWRFAEPVTGAKIAGLTVIGAGLPLVLFR
ncbi:MAG: hypothetical protein SFV21_07175, partial [Rhodospirillaceae bacterium]|nr:hypothetical protein [Rhodospirillaceae bacterium]